MNSASESNKKSLIFSVIFHVVILGLLMGFETNQIIRISPQQDDTPIIDASLVFNRPVARPLFQEPKPERKPEPIKSKAEPEPEPEIITKNIVVIKTEKTPPKPDKKREKELKKMAEKSLEQAFKQENLQEDLQENLHKKLQEHDLEIRQSAAVSQSELNQHMTLIASKVTKNWRQPIDTKITGLSCIVLIKTLANGDVIDVRVIQSSGNLGFDRSTEIAVRKSSPLPIPRNEMARAQFKQFEFSFRPEA
jgi:colicin import membrane protein